MPPQKILIVQLNRLGDFILATPMLRALKEDHPQHQIHVLASRHNQGLARTHPLIDQVLVHSKKPAGVFKLLLNLRREAYDYWIDPKDHFSREGYWFARWAKARHKVGFNSQARKALFDVPIPAASENYHEQVAVRNLRALQIFGLQNADPRPLLCADPRFEEKLSAFLGEQEMQKYFCVHLSASKDIRYWPQANWIAFLREMADDRRHFVITCDPADAARAQEIVAAVSQARYYRAESFIDLFSAVKHAELVISPDTSLVHVAAAFDRPLLGLYANEEWNFKKFRPLSTHHRVVIDSKPGALVRDIPLDLMLVRYRELIQEISL